VKTLIIFLLAFSFIPGAQAYPLYGSEDRNIPRLEGYQKRPKPKGAMLDIQQVDLRLLDRPDITIPAEADKDFSREVRRLLRDNKNRYFISVLDLSDPDNLRYAAHNENGKQNPGSVGKIVIALAMFQALADVYPDDIDARMRILRETIVTCDDFIIKNHHKVPFFNEVSKRLTWRHLKIGDKGSLFTFLDWMCSASSNAAASMVIREAMLLRHFGKEYPVSEERIKAFFKTTPAKEKSELLKRTLITPLEQAGIDTGKFRQGNFFTWKAKTKAAGVNSYGTPREMLKFMLYMEQGKLVDEFSSREIKRLLYMTQRRIRYASSPALSSSALYFKSGSLYSCMPEEGFKCGKYMGNRINLLNSVCTVESPAGANNIFYISVIMSNVLRVNSAVAHQGLGTFIHRIIERMHPEAKTLPAAQE
jgi:hypothetical protein